MSQIGYHTTFTVDNLTDGRSFGLGDKITDHDGKDWIYVQANGAIGQYDAVGVDETHAQAAALTKAIADDGWRIGAAAVAFADNDYGFVQITGIAEVNVLADCAPDVALYTSGTAGSLDDNSTSQTKIDGVVQVDAAATQATNTTCIMTWPKSTTF